MSRRIVLGLVCWVGVGTQAAVLPGQEPAGLRHEVDTVRAALGIRGVAVAALVGGTLWTVVAGEAVAGVPVTRATAFQIGSVTKTFTAALVLQLVVAGALALDTPLAGWFPDLSNAERITVRQVLNHTSGTDDVFQQDGFTVGLFMNPIRRWAPAEIVARAGESLFEPGRGWAYSSTGYVALGGILEEVTGMPLAELFRERLFEPFGLPRTYLGGFEPVDPPEAHGFVDVNDDGVEDDLTAMVPATGFLTAAGAAGAIVSTAEDMARWIHALGTGRVVPNAVWPAMTDWVDRPDGHQHGLGLLRVRFDDVELIGHRGNSAGYSAAAWYAPSHGAAVAVLTNKNGLTVTPFVRLLLQYAGVLQEGGN